MRDVKGEGFTYVGRRADRGALGANAEREDFGDEDPGPGAPGVSEVDDIEPDENYGEGESGRFWEKVESVGEEGSDV